MLVRVAAIKLTSRLVRMQRLASPIDRDKREQPMLNFVPSTRARRKVAHRDRDLQYNAYSNGKMRGALMPQPLGVT